MRHLAAFVSLLAAIVLSACTSTNPTSALSALTKPESGAAADSTLLSAGTESPAGTVSGAATVAPVANPTTIAIAPTIGAPAEEIPALTQSLTARASQLGIKVAATGTKNVAHVLKGYFSAIADGSRTTVIYVWDVLDPSGTRLHRIQGQESVAGGSGDGWSSVPAATMQAIGTATIDQYAAWLASGQTQQTAGG